MVQAPNYTAFNDFVTLAQYVIKKVDIHSQAEQMQLTCVI